LGWDARRHAELLAPGIAASRGSIDEVRVFPATLGDPGLDLRDALVEALP
jgi:hypothetical protein